MFDLSGCAVGAGRMREANILQSLQSGTWCVRRGASRPTTLTVIHTRRMVIHMKTTLNIDDTVMARLRRESARTGRTMSELVEMALRQLLQRRTDAPALAPLPSFDSGGALVDVSNRDALYRVMDDQ